MTLSIEIYVEQSSVDLYALSNLKKMALIMALVIESDLIFYFTRL